MNVSLPAYFLMPAKIFSTASQHWTLESWFSLEQDSASKLSIYGVNIYNNIVKG